MSKCILKVFRGTPGNQYFEEFELDYNASANIISLLMAIQRNPINKKGVRVEPIVWEMGCLEEVCGSCSMLVNGKPRQSCTALIKNIINETNNCTITLAPLSKFPLVRDLIVDRTSMFDALKNTSAWIDVKNSHQNGEAQIVIKPQEQDVMYKLSTCMTCGCCLEACPQVNENSPFEGAAVISQVRLFNLHPLGKKDAPKRLHAMMQESGITGCGNAQNCVKVCPKNIPLTESIAIIFRDTLKQSLYDVFHARVEE